LLPTILIFDATPSKASPASILNAFIIETRPVVASSIVAPGEIDLNRDETYAIVFESFRLS
jgi:hypothetical protein